MRFSKKSASTTFKIKMHRTSNKSKKPLILVKRIWAVWYLFSAALLSYNPLSWLLDSSATGLIFVSPICQASSCFKAFFNALFHVLKILAAPPLPHISMAHYFSLLESPRAAYLIPNNLYCIFLFLLPYSNSSCFKCSFVYSFVSFCLLLLDSMRVGICMAGLISYTFRKIPAAILEIQ